MYRVQTLTAENTFTEPIPILGEFNFSITGSWSGSITLMRSYDRGATWEDIRAFTENFSGWDKEPMPHSLPSSNMPWYRAGFKTGDFGSGSATVRLGQN